LLTVKGGAATSDFLLSLLVSASFMRLSSLKAARVAVGEYRAARNPGQAAFFLLQQRIAGAVAKMLGNRRWLTLKS
jgi:hypothetical protein